MMQQCEEVYRARGFDFHAGWFPLVRLLSTRGPCSPSEATCALGVTPASISQVASELVRQRLVSSRKDRNDRRRRILDLTQKGRQLAEELDPLWQKIRRTAESILADTGLDLDVVALVEDAFDRGALYEGVTREEVHSPEKAPSIRTPRLILRPFARQDADALRRLAADREVADRMISLPHPLRRENLQHWIRARRLELARGSAFHFAVEQPEEHRLLGAVELREVDLEHLQAPRSASGSESPGGVVASRRRRRKASCASPSRASA